MEIMITIILQWLSVKRIRKSQMFMNFFFFVHWLSVKQMRKMITSFAMACSNSNSSNANFYGDYFYFFAMAFIKRIRKMQKFLSKFNANSISKFLFILNCFFFKF